MPTKNLVLNQQITTKEQELLTVQSSEVTKSAKYKYVPRTKLADYEYEVHEIVAPDGSIGYVTYYFIDKDGVKYLKSVGHGRDEKEHTKDWAVYDPTGV